MERNFEVAIQCCIDIAQRIIALEGAPTPADYYSAFITLGELDILPGEKAKKIAPLAGLRNILVHQYLDVRWQVVYEYLQHLEIFYDFVNYMKKWLKHNIATEGKRK